MNAIADNMYLQAWIIYGLAAVVLYIYWWRFTGRMGDGLFRRLLRWGLFATLVIPAYSIPGEDALAPAFVVGIIAQLSADTELVSQALRPLWSGLALGSAVIFVSWLVAVLRGRGSEEAPAAAD